MFPRTTFPPVIFPPPVFPEPAGGRPPPAPGPWLGWLPLMGGGRSVPFSLLGAIDAYWTANGLDVSLAPLFPEGAKASQDLPFIVIDGINDDLAGITDDDKQVDMFLTVWAASSSQATAIARSIVGIFGNPTAVPTKTVDREPFAWSVGSEKFAEPIATQQSMTGKPYKIGRVFKNRMHYCWYISGNY